MATNYIVVLDQPAKTKAEKAECIICQEVFAFPRGFHYKKDANECLANVEKEGGKAHIIPKSQFSAELIRLLRKVSK